MYEDTFIKLSKENCNLFIQDIMKDELMPIKDLITIADLIYLLECRERKIDDLNEEISELKEKLKERRYRWYIL